VLNCKSSKQAKERTLLGDLREFRRGGVVKRGGHSETGEGGTLTDRQGGEETSLAKGRDAHGAQNFSQETAREPGKTSRKEEKKGSVKTLKEEITGVEEQSREAESHRPEICVSITILLLDLIGGVNQRETSRLGVQILHLSPEGKEGKQTELREDLLWGRGCWANSCAQRKEGERRRIYIAKTSEEEAARRYIHYP